VKPTRVDEPQQNTTAKKFSKKKVKNVYVCVCVCVCMCNIWDTYNILQNA